MTTPTDDELLALAKKATQGEWQYPGIDEVNPDLITAGRDHDGAFIYPIDADENEADNRAFVAAANPAAIIALIERHRAEVAQLRADRDLAYDKLARKGAEVEELRQYAPMCLVCGARKPCMTEADLKPGDPGTPCTFDPTPKEAAAEIRRLRAEVERLTRERDEAFLIAREKENQLVAANLDAVDLSKKQRYANHYEEQIAFLVERFAEALSSKLRKAEEKYQYQGAWRRAGWASEIREALLRHVDKGDPLDVAAYCAFAWHHGWTLAAPDTAPTSAETALAAAMQDGALLRDLKGQVERLTRENNNLSAGQKHALESCWAAESALRAERKRVGELEEALEEIASNVTSLGDALDTACNALRRKRAALAGKDAP